MTQPSYSESLAQWIYGLNYDDLPETVREDAKLRILDILGTTLAASTLESSRVMRNGALAIAPGDACHILGFGDPAEAAGAALVNGTMAHALDYDDTHLGSVVHISAPVVTTALTLGEMLQASGTALLTAVVAGAEIGCRIGSVAPKLFHQQGYHATAVVGTFAATGTAAKMLNLDAQQTANALGIAGSQSSGILQCFNDGTWTKQFHVGWSAHAAVIAAKLAQAGFTGPNEVLEGIQGFYKIYAASGKQYPERLLDALGSRWEYPTASFKPYPCGHVAHGFLDCILQLYDEEGLRANQVEAITCPIADWMIPIMCEPRDIKLQPKTDYHAKFSFPFTIAAALTFGRLGVEAFSDDNIHDPELLALAKKIVHVVDPSASTAVRFKGWVKVDTKDGRQLERIVEDSWGSDVNPMTPRQIIEKFRDNAARVLPESNIAAIVDQVRLICDLSEVGDLVANCIAETA